jgi:hypothetical protein
MERMARDREHWLAIDFRVIQAVQQMDTARSGRGEANAESAGVFRVAAGRKRSRLLMPHLDEPDLVLMSSECFEDAVYAIARQSKNSVYTPIDKAGNQQVSDRS